MENIKEFIKSNMSIIIGIVGLTIIVLFIFLLGSSKSNVGVQNIVLDRKYLNLSVGNSYDLKVIVSPSNATDKEVYFTSSNSNVATIDNEGHIEGVNEGKAIITVTSKNGKRSECNVTVIHEEIPATSINFETTDLELIEEESTFLKIKVTPTDTTEHDFEWTSSDPSVATVSGGKITAISPGTTLITAMTKNKKIAICDVTVKAKGPKEIKLSSKEGKIKVGETFKINATVLPEEVPNKALTWKSSNSSVATVKNGTIEGEGAGTAIITATAVNDVSATFKITVEEEIFDPITEIAKYRNGFATFVEYNSSTFKYRIQVKNGNDYVLIWVKDPYMQLNSALPKLGVAYSAEDNLKQEISKYGYQSKGLVAVNGGFFWDGWGDSPAVPFVINKGNILRDIENKTYPNVYGLFGLTKKGELKSYPFSKNYAKNVKAREELLKDKVRNSFSFAMAPIGEDGSLLKYDGRKQNTSRNVLCQINRNNFVLFSGSNTNLYLIGKDLKETFGCKVAFNLDGGSSRKLYYKTSSMTTATKRFGGSRKTPDMLYFVEK